ncbi:hypothetical protein EDB86DRAFT_2913038 [Lactarius hatsudake]|nr:hypothetical protein EDB86DRAFT_2913038 [Lactarius hatsudake]
MGHITASSLFCHLPNAIGDLSMPPATHFRPCTLRVRPLAFLCLSHAIIGPYPVPCHYLPCRMTTVQRAHYPTLTSRIYTCAPVLPTGFAGKPAGVRRMAPLERKMCHSHLASNSASRSQFSNLFPPFNRGTEGSCYHTANGGNFVQCRQPALPRPYHGRQAIDARTCTK